MQNRIYIFIIYSKSLWCFVSPISWNKAEKHCRNYKGYHHHPFQTAVELKWYRTRGQMLRTGKREKQSSMKCQTTFLRHFLLYFHKCMRELCCKYLKLFIFIFWLDFLALKKPCLMILSILKEKKNYILHNGLHVWVPSGRSTIISLSSLREETICLKDATTSLGC